MEHADKSKVLTSIQNFPKYFQNIQDAKWKHLTWKGMTLMKDPMSLAIYQQLMQDLKPKTIIEFGTYQGGSAQWMADICRVLGFDTVVYTFDNQPDRVKVQDPGIRFMYMDAYNINQFVEQNYEMFAKILHPILVIEDCHANSVNLCLAINQFLESGDYLVIEDTINDLKYTALQAFIAACDQYEIDRSYCDFWGHNNTWNIDSFLLKK